MKEIKVTTNNTVEDFIRFNIFTLEKYHKLKAQYIFLIIFGLFSIVFSFFSDSFYLLFIIGLLFIFMRLFYPYQIKRRIRKYVQESPSIINNGEITFSEQGIIEVTNITTVNVKWEDLYSFDEDGELLFIFFTKMQAFIVHRDLLTDNEMYQLIDWKNK